jgi:hypothetical protein
MSQTKLVTVSFHNDNLIAFEQEGQHYVAMKPIVENIGLDWKAQHARIKRHPVMSKGMVMMDIPSSGGSQTTSALPLTMLNGWLFGVDVNRVRAELREKLIRYQTECFDVLAKHFMPQQANTIGYDKITSAQAQELKELVQLVVESGKQGYSETWARLHRKFHVNSYLQLPAAKFTEACMYLKGKLDGESIKSLIHKHIEPEVQQIRALPDANRLSLAFNMASELASQAQQAVFAALVNGQDPEWLHKRYLFGVTYGKNNQLNEVYAQPIPNDAHIASFQDLAARICSGDTLASNADLAAVAAACSSRLQQRMMARLN